MSERYVQYSWGISMQFFQISKEPRCAESHWLIYLLRFFCRLIQVLLSAIMRIYRWIRGENLSL